MIISVCTTTHISFHIFIVIPTLSVVLYNVPYIIGPSLYLFINKMFRSFGESRNKDRMKLTCAMQELYAETP